MSAFAGLDPEQALASAHELSIAVARVSDALADIDGAESIAEVADLTAVARVLVGELHEDLLLSIALLRTRAEMMLVADRYDPITAGYVGRGLLARQANYGAGLAERLDDRVGSDGTGDDVRRHLERRTWELAGYDHDPYRAFGPLAPGAVDRQFEDLQSALRPAERMRLCAALYQRFGAVDVDDDADRLHVATTIATLIVDARVTRSAGRYWTTLDADEQEQLISDVPELLAASLAPTRLLDGDVLDVLDTDNAYAVFSEEVRAEFELEINVKYFMIELGGNVSAVFSKRSDGSVRVVVGLGVKAGAGLKLVDASISAGLYADKAYTLTFPDEASAAAALGPIRNAIEADTPDNPWEVVVDRLPGGIDITPLVVKQFWDEHGSEEYTEAGLYAEFEAELEHNGIKVASGDFDVQLGGYEARDADGNGIEHGAVMRLAGSVEGDGTVGNGGVDGEVEIRAFAVGEGPSMLEVRLTGEMAAGIDGGVDEHATGRVAQMVQRLGVSFEGKATRGIRSTVTITLPLTKATGSAAWRALTEDDDEGFDDLYELADVEVIGERVSGQSMSAEFERGPLDIEGTVEHVQVRAIDVWRKRPFGEMYSAIDIDRAIEDGRRAG